MPPKAEKAGGETRTDSSLTSLRYLAHSVCLLSLAAISSPLSQLKLAPVYGSLPSAQFHHLGTALLVLLALTKRSLFSRWVPDRAIVYLQALACWIPTLQTFLFKYSSRLGPTLGPVLTEALTFYPLVFLTAYSASGLLLSAQIDRYVHRSLGGGVLGLSGYGLFTVLEFYAWRVLAWAASLSEYLTRTTIQVIVGAAYFSISPKKLYIATLLPLLQTVLFDPHFSSPVAVSTLNSTLQGQEWTLLDRGDSVTGYVSVLENTEQQFRVMRCDHSLLGGEWLLTSERLRDGITVPEPIYVVFAMLEAVRLVQLPHQSKTSDEEKSALVIGLGIGTAPKALISHGIATTIVELDPLVHEYATKYFGLPSNHTAILQDAVSWVQEQAASPTSETNAENDKHKRYDYIIHDVFTGGAEPLDLFTAGFLENLKSLLSPDGGVIALNYAGDLSNPGTKLVLNTINTVFNRQCRMYRDQPPLSEKKAAADEKDSAASSPSSSRDEDAGDFANMVIFCTKSRTPIVPLTFRAPTPSDFLSSRSREHFLLPKAHLELAFPSERDMRELQLPAVEKADRRSATPMTVLRTRGEVRTLDKAQIRSAKRHWAIMRRVVPDFVWEGY